MYFSTNQPGLKDDAGGNFTGIFATAGPADRVRFGGSVLDSALNPLEVKYSENMWTNGLDDIQEFSFGFEYTPNGAIAWVTFEVECITTPCRAFVDGMTARTNKPTGCDEWKTCEQLNGATCGTYDDFCGGNLTCGSCTNPDESCDMCRQCTCDPIDCTGRCSLGGANPGNLTNACNPVGANCGACGPDESCQSDHRCTCNAIPCSGRCSYDFGGSTGPGAITNACNSTGAVCATCSTQDEICNSTTRSCECPPVSLAACAGKCGVETNGCGETRQCTCGPGFLCDTSSQLCRCLPLNCTVGAAVKCGTLTNVCGESLDCGSCAGGLVCDGSNSCVAASTGAPATTTSSSSQPSSFWLFVGIVVGAVLLLCCIAVVGFVVFRRRQKHGASSTSSEAELELQPLPPDSGESSNYTTVPKASGDPSEYQSCDLNSTVNDSPEGTYGRESEGTYGVMPKEAMEGTVYSGIPLAARAGSSSWEIPPSELMWGPELGRGAYGIVFDGLWRESRVAIKVLTHLTPKALEEFEKEAAVMQNLKPHDNVVELLGVCSEPVALITEFVDFGCLKEWRKQTGANASEEELMQITRGVANGVLYLHNEGIIHRDLAARNVLLTKDLIPKVADFGCAREDSGDNKTETDVGPLKWMAPECIDDQGYSFKTDVWAYGIVLVELFTAAAPYPGQTAVKVAARVAAGRYAPYSPLPSAAPTSVQELILSCTAYDPDSRPDFKHILAML